MKTKLTLFFSVLLVLGTNNILNAQIIFSEGFESLTIPSGWSQSYVIGTRNWSYQNGGQSENPSSAYSGSYNALFFYGSYGNETTRLITPQINTTILTTPLLTFWHAQKAFGGDIDELKVYYRENTGDTWHLLANWSDEVSLWTKRELLLPVSSTTLQIAFEARTGYGYGVCIDEMKIEEAPTVDKFVESLSVFQDEVEFAFPGTNNNSILRIEIDVEGFTGNLFLNQISVNSQNTNDLDINSAGVKIFHSQTNNFNSSIQLSTGTDFNSQTAIFSGVNFDLPTGINYIWITYDLKTSAVPNNIIDAGIFANEINIGGNTFPATNSFPAGEKIILQTIYYDDFEINSGWTLSGEFEISTPMGLGGSYGDPDPGIAYSGTNVLGTDLSGLGLFPYDYEPGISDKEYQAVSPLINCSFFVNTSLKFQRWLNIDYWDNATIEISNNNGGTWNVIWESTSLMEASDWTLQELDISNFADDQPEVIIRFTLGSTDGTWNYSGWNIDNFAVTGDFIENETGVTSIISPVSGCGHGTSELITVVVRNFAGAATNDTIPVCFSPDGGITVVRDTIFGSIPVGSDTIYSFIPTANLSIPGLNLNIFAATVLPFDEFGLNDTIFSTISLIPSYSASYFEDFESGNGFWIESGVNSSWELGSPSGTQISSAASGINCWITNLSGYYNDNEFSMVESPCFDFSGSENLILELKANWLTDLDFDGAAIMYSIDMGNTWSLLGSISSGENWYNHNNIEGLLSGFGVSEGWNNNSEGWISLSHDLPAELNNQTGVRFKIIFGSDNSVNHFDGFAFDDVRIKPQSPDIALVEILLPESACELSDNENITIIIHNTGNLTLLSGEEISLSYSINGLTPLTEILSLTEIFYPDSIIEFAFAPTSAFDAPGDYEIIVSALLLNDNNPLNDSAFRSVSVYGFPNVNLGTDIYTMQPDTVVLNAWIGDNYQYLWTGGITDSVFYVGLPGTYSVTVSDLFGCSASDQIVVHTYNADLTVNGIIFPQSSCSFTNSEQMRINIKNTGNYIFPAGSQILLSWSINGSGFTSETINLPGDFPVNSNLQYTFASPADMSEITEYELVFAVYQSFDINPDNDSLVVIISAFGYPEPNLGADTIFTNQPDTIILNAGEGYNSYLWNDLSTDQFLIVLAYGEFFVEVTNNFGCIGRDTIVVELINMFQEFSQNNILVYPNPFVNNLCIDAERIELPTHFEIINSMGKIVYAGELNKEITELFVSDLLSSGIYTIRFRTNSQETFTKKIIKN
jgi:hypothetical protein